MGFAEEELDKVAKSREGKNKPIIKLGGVSFNTIDVPMVLLHEMAVVIMLTNRKGLGNHIGMGMKRGVEKHGISKLSQGDKEDWHSTKMC